MKKPVAIYFVAAWCLIAFSLTIGGVKISLRTHFVEGEHDWLKTMTGFVGILAIWHVYQLVQLKAFNRWLSVAFFGWWTLTLTWNGVVIFSRLEHSRHLRVLVVIIVAALLNLASIWFLVRRSFREFAVQFVSERAKERHSRLMQKTAQKRIAREIRNMRS